MELNVLFFCFSCLLYGRETIWTYSGFRNINKIKEKYEKHQNSLKILNSYLLSLLGQDNISEQLSEAYRTSNLKHNEQVTKKIEKY